MRASLIHVLLALLVLVHRANAEEPPPPAIVVVGGDVAFREALADVLVTTDVHAVGELATPALAELAAESRRLAETNFAVATVWLSIASAGATLVTYDRTVDRFLVRELPYALPLSATQAAEAARMVRTMLRALRSSDDDAIVSAIRPRVTPPPAPRPPEFAASLGIGAWFAAPEAYATPQMSLAIAWRPHGLGAGLVATLAPAAEIETSTFRGDVRDIVIAAEVRQALRVAERVRVTPGLGLALHALSLEGAFGSSDMIQSRRYDPAVRTGLVVAVELPYAIDLGLRVSADCLLQRQRYEAGTERILLVPRVQIMMAAFVGIRL